MKSKYKQLSLFDKFPCSINDTVYLIEGTLQDYEIVKCIIDSFGKTVDKSHTDYVNLNRANDSKFGYRFKIVPLDFFGESLFLTRGEAETHVKKLNKLRMEQRTKYLSVGKH